MIDRNHDLPIARQAKVLNISRGSVYYKPRPVSAADLAIMRRIDELHLDCPFAGSRMLRDMLGREGFVIGRRHVATLMKRMGIEAIYRRPNTSKPAPGHKIYPYLLRGLTVDGPTRSGRWTSPTSRWRAALSISPPSSTGSAAGFSSWRLSITMEADFCIEALEEALAKYGRPEIFNTDQGSQFTSERFHRRSYQNAGIAISMDGKGAWRDNVFVERIWKSVKYEEVYLRAYGSVGEARASLGRYLDFYNGRRPHSSLDRQTPDEAYFDHTLQKAAA